MSDLPRGEHISAALLARKLGRNIKTIYRLIRIGELPAKKVGVRWYVSRDVAEELIRIEKEKRK